jgi:phosphotransferase system HPr-like phosphotransfer protein
MLPKIESLCRKFESERDSISEERKLILKSIAKASQKLWILNLEIKEKRTLFISVPTTQGEAILVKFGQVLHQNFTESHHASTPFLVEAKSPPFIPILLKLWKA